MFFYGDVLCRRRYVTGDVLLRRHSVTETFGMETFCRGDVLCGDVLYVRQNNSDRPISLSGFGGTGTRIVRGRHLAARNHMI
jgi:hypothetical protein